MPVKIITRYWRKFYVASLKKTAKIKYVKKLFDDIVNIPFISADAFI